MGKVLVTLININNNLLRSSQVEQVHKERWENIFLSRGNRKCMAMLKLILDILDRSQHDTPYKHYIDKHLTLFYIQQWQAIESYSAQIRLSGAGIKNIAQMCLNAQCRVRGCGVRVVGGGGLRTNTSTSLAFMFLEMEICHRFSIQSF